MKSLAGQFLVASPHLRDPNFAKSVVLMLQHEEQGALGIVVNRPSDKTIDEVWELIGAEPCGLSELVYVGGPVPGPIIAVHDQRQHAEKEVLPQLFMSMQKDSIDALVRQHGAKFRLFSGHSGWGAGQLENEMRVGGWLTWPAVAADVFAEHEEIWKSLCARISRQIVASDIPPERLPKNPEMN